MTSCGRERDLATLECFGRGSQGTIFVRSSKLSLFFPELCPFRRVFCLPRFWKIWRQTTSSGAFGFNDVLELFLKTPLLHQAFFANSDFNHEFFFEKFLSFFKAEPMLLAWQLWWSPGWAKHFGGGTLKTRMKTWLLGVGKIECRRTVNRRRDWYESRVRWSMVQKRNKQKKTQASQRVIVRSLNPSSSTNQRVLRSLFPRPDVATALHFAVIMYMDVQLQVDQAAARKKRRKAVIRDTSGVDHRGVTNLSAPIWFTGQRHCTVFRKAQTNVLLALTNVLIPKANILEGSLKEKFAP